MKKPIDLGISPYKLFISPLFPNSLGDWSLWSTKTGFITKMRIFPIIVYCTRAYPTKRFKNVHWDDRFWEVGSSTKEHCSIVNEVMFQLNTFFLIKIYSSQKSPLFNFLHISKYYKPHHIERSWHKYKTVDYAILKILRHFLD